MKIDRFGKFVGNTRLMNRIVFSVVAVLGAALSNPGKAAEDTAEYDESEVLFARRIAPLLREKCVACHGENADEIEGGFDLRALKSATAGGDSAEPGIVPGKPEESSIYLAARREEETFEVIF